MKPDQKYMPSFRKSYDGDIKFKPFAPTSPLNLSPIALIPMLSFNDSSINNILPHELKDNSRVNTSDNSKEEENNTNKENSFTFPDNFQIDTLYSYNNVSNKNSDKKISESTVDTDNKKNLPDNRLLPNELLKDFDLNLDEDVDLFRNCCNSEISNVYNYIKNENPGIITLLESYNIPKPMIRLIIRRIIKLTLNYNYEK